jgi:hypothetical protein
MASINIHVHPHSNFAFAPLEELVGVLDIKETNVDDNGTGEPEPVKGLAFIDGDGEGHVYVLTERGRQKLIAQLSGGIVVP